MEKLLKNLKLIDKYKPEYSSIHREYIESLNTDHIKIYIQGIEWLSERFKAYATLMSEKDAVSFYRKEKKRRDNFIKEFNEIIENAPRFKLNMLLFRGEVGIIPVENSDTTKRYMLKEGDKIFFPAFTSFSLDYKVAYNFKYANCCLFIIDFDSSIPYLITGNLYVKYGPPESESEFEVILPPSGFRIKKILYLPHRDKNLKTKVFLLE